MSVNTQYYTVYGVKLPYLNTNDEDEMYDRLDSIGAIIDAMGGEYMVFGKVLFECDDEGYGDSMTEIDPLMFGTYEHDYREMVKKTAPELYRYIAEEPFRLLSFVHYS